MILTFGPYNCVNAYAETNGGQFMVFNLTSLREGLVNLNLLPPRNFTYLIDKDFDIQYSNYIMSNDETFYNLFNVIYQLYQGQEVYITTATDFEECDIISESLQKFIQQRYGIISNNVNEPEDVDYVKHSEFTIQGLFNFDQDKERFTRLFVLTNDLHTKQED